jgi:hypothetical protein
LIAAILLTSASAFALFALSIASAAFAVAFAFLFAVPKVFFALSAFSFLASPRTFL